MQDTIQQLQEEFDLLRQLSNSLQAKFNSASHIGISDPNLSENFAGFNAGLSLRYSSYAQAIDFSFEVARAKGGRYRFGGKINLSQELQLKEPTLQYVYTLNPHPRNQHSITKSAKQAFAECADQVVYTTSLFVEKYKTELVEAQAVAAEYFKLRDKRNKLRSDRMEVDNRIRAVKLVIEALNVQPSARVNALMAEHTEQIALTI